MLPPCLIQVHGLVLFDAAVCLLVLPCRVQYYPRARYPSAAKLVRVGAWGGVLATGVLFMVQVGAVLPACLLRAPCAGWEVEGTHTPHRALGR